MEPMKEFYEKQAAVIIKNLKKRNMDGYYCASCADAVAKAMELIGKDSSVGFGGSMTLKECGLMDALNASDVRLLDRSEASGADYFLMSTNAITLDGQLVNIDGSGNRVASLIYGPAHVVIIAGMNKVAKDVDSAIERVHTTAAPPNAMRLSMNTPCGVTGVCADCLSADCICAHTVITRYSRISGRIAVILVGESLGY